LSEPRGPTDLAMSRQIVQPVGQIKLTNVAVVRLQTHGKRFECACYKNKVVNFRQGIETDLDEVLQSDRVFTNVSKGRFAKRADLEACFGTADEEECCRIIIKGGTLEVSEMERSAQLEATTREVASMVAAKCIDPRSGRPYTVPQIRDAMVRAEFRINPSRSVKQQFLDCVRLIRAKAELRIQRAPMELCVVVDVGADANAIKNANGTIGAVVERLKEAGVASEIDVREGNRLVFLADPSLFRSVDAIAKDEQICGSGGRLEIIRQLVLAEGDVNMGSEVSRKEGERLALLQRAEAGRKGEDEEDQIVSVLANEMVGGMALSKNEEVHTEEIAPTMNTRKANKKAQKKSKKAKRREKEEAAERQARIDAEMTRQAARANRLGLAPQAEGEEDADQEKVGGDKKSCNTCGGSFTPAQYRQHFRSDWHRYNQQLKLKGCMPVSKAEFDLQEEFLGF